MTRERPDLFNVVERDREIAAIRERLARLETQAPGDLIDAAAQLGEGQFDLPAAAAGTFRSSRGAWKNPNFLAQFGPRGVLKCVATTKQGADTGDYAGLEDEIDNHWGELFKAALLSTVLGVGSELGAVAILQAQRLGAANSLNRTGQQVVCRNLNIQPTLTIRPGFPVRVIVNRDLVLDWQHLPVHRLPGHQAILDAASSLFLERGIAATRMEVVAERASVSNGVWALPRQACAAAARVVVGFSGCRQSGRSAQE